MLAEQPITGTFVVVEAANPLAKFLIILLPKFPLDLGARATSEIRKVKLAIDTWPDLETKKDIIELKTAGYLGTG